MVSFVRGFAYPVRGLAFAWRRPDLRRLLAGPLCLGVGLVASELYALASAIHHYLPHASAWKIGLAWLGGCVLALFAFLGLQGAVAAPFCDAISKRAEAHLLGAPPPSAGLRGQLGSLAQALARGSIYLAGLVVIFACGFFVPLAWVASLLWSAAYAALDSLDYPTSRRRWGWRDKLALLGRHTGSTFGFGIAAALMTAIPGVGLLVAPAAAVGATLLFHDLDLGRVKE
jgi:CysZ protein